MITKTLLWVAAIGSLFSCYLALCAIKSSEYYGIRQIEIRELITRSCPGNISPLERRIYTIDDNINHIKTWGMKCEKETPSNTWKCEFE